MRVLASNADGVRSTRSPDIRQTTGEEEKKKDKKEEEKRDSILIEHENMFKCAYFTTQRAK